MMCRNIYNYAAQFGALFWKEIHIDNEMKFFDGLGLMVLLIPRTNYARKVGLLRPLQDILSS